jgi:transglutaminase-like putative cysteine protease
MPILTVDHRTTYRYANAVHFGVHRMMMRPRDSHDLRLLETSLILRPAASVRWIHDVFGNSIAIAKFGRPATELHVASTFRTEHFPLPENAVQVEDYARHYPFSYESLELPDITPSAKRHYPDPEQRVDLWARHFVETAPARTPLGILSAMTRAIQSQFTYNPRDEMGTGNLGHKNRDLPRFALLLMEAARSLGFAARFVSGYLYDDRKIRGGPETVIGGGVTHAWTQVYLPGAGRVPFDPKREVSSAGRRISSGWMCRLRFGLARGTKLDCPLPVVGSTNWVQIWATITFCRCMNNPARYCTGYLGGIGVPPISQDDQRSDNECAIRASLETVSHLILRTKWLPV